MRDHGNGRFVLACLTVFLMLQAGAALGQSDDAEWEPITEERLLDPRDGDWMSYRRTYDVTGFSPLDQIDRDNVSDLRLVWSWSMRDNSRWVPTPIVANGLMYVSEGSGRVTAFDVLSGDVAWVYTRSYPEDIQKSQALGRHRGVSVLGDTVYFGAADAVLVALDAQTGEPRWEVSTGDYTTGLGHSHPPLVADGKVVLGVRRRRPQRARHHRRARRRDRRAHLDHLHGAAAGRAGLRDLDRAGSPAAGRPGLEHHQLRPGARPHLHGHRTADPVGLDPARPGRCALHQLHPGPEHRHRRDRVVLPGRAGRQLGPGRHRREHAGRPGRSAASSTRR